MKKNQWLRLPLQDVENLIMKLAGSPKFALPALLVLASLVALLFTKRCEVIPSNVAIVCLTQLVQVLCIFE